MVKVRINKYLADQGLAGRREADRLIEAGQVKLNGAIAKLGDQVAPGDKVELTAPSDAKIYLAYHKPRNLATEDIVSPPGTFPLGRLDKESEGLMLFSDDGRLPSRLLDPEHHAEKEYVVEVDKKLSGFALKRLTGGLLIEGYRTHPAAASRINDNTFRIVLTEGKKHQIRRMCAALGYQVLSLRRIRIANIRLQKERPGTFRTLSPREEKALLSELGLI